MNRELLLNFAIGLGLPLVAGVALLLDEPFVVTLATRIAILGLAGVGLNLALGLGGLVSFGHAVFFGIGGYAVGVLASHAQLYTPIMTWPIEISGSSSMPVIWLVAIVASALAGLLIGAISLRTSGVYFIMITLAFGQMAYYFAISWPAYGGEDGLSIYVRNSFPRLKLLVPFDFFVVAYCVLLCAILLFSRVAISPFGLALNATRQNLARVQSVGIETYRLQLTAFVLSAVITGLAGALYADLNRYVSPSMLSWTISGEIMIFVILGGVGRTWGPVLGAAVFVILEQWLGGVSEYWQIFLGVILLAVVLFARGGLYGMIAGEARHHG
ncbi:branched-chain amino acid ABC transporter permease [Amaricoccus tamworthensis]|uniref:branched-chain amino acid ABC transporter permease n=1 Tax=Amaricoccus tamworthensis TaxID=57002 RepID=UPI003C7D7A01